MDGAGVPPPSCGESKGKGDPGMAKGLGVLFAAALALASAGPAAADTVRTSLALWGEPKLADGFDHLPYVNPDAPKGGKTVFGALGSFDSLNTLILRGDYPRSIDLIFDTLLTATGDELSAAYPLIAERMELADDLSAVVFVLRDSARWQDGQPITAGDFAYTWKMIQAHGRPFLKSFLDKTASVEALDPHRLRVTFTTRNDRKPILDFATTVAPYPEHWWTANGRDISKTTLEPPVSSGPYRVVSVDPGRSVVYERVKNYWGRDLPVNRGLYNFDRIQVDYYRDTDVMFEAFKAGAYDFQLENRAQRWTTSYDFPAMKDGRVARRTEHSDMPQGAQGFRLNTRRPQLADPRVREALAHLFDFTWTQKNLLNGQYARTKSNFPNSDYGASGMPDAAEREVLEPYRDRLDPRVLTQAFEPPAGGDMRTEQRIALALLKDAGWEMRNGAMVKTVTNEPFKLEFLEEDPSGVRIAQPYVTNLKKIGIDATIRLVDSAQMQVRQDEFDFDVDSVLFNFFPPPGPDLLSYFGSEAAKTKGSANLSGITDPVVDELLAKALNAKDEATQKAMMRALDRVMLWGWYMVPEWYNAENRIAYKTRFGWPNAWPRYDIVFRNVGIPTWWWIADPKER